MRCVPEPFCVDSTSAPIATAAIPPAITKTHGDRWCSGFAAPAGSLAGPDAGAGAGGAGGIAAAGIDAG
jgi:hypothetical protein